MIVKELVFGENTELKEKELDNSAIAQWVSSRWVNWSKNYNTVLVDQYRNAITPKARKETSEVKDWHSTISLNKPFSYYNKIYSIISNTIRNELPKYISVGKDVQNVLSDEIFNLQNKMEILLSASDYIIAGEAIGSAYIEYKKEIKSVPFDNLTGQENIIGVYDNAAKIEVEDENSPSFNFLRVLPENFACDPLYQPNCKEWEKCGKIIKTWETKSSLLANKSYDLNSEQLEQILPPQYNNLTGQDDKNTNQSIRRSNQIEVLTYFGDLEIDGELYRDYCAIIVGRSVPVYFKPINKSTPKVFYCKYGAEKRGISPIAPLIEIFGLEDQLINDTINHNKLRLNPALYAPIGFFEKDKTEVAPGLHIPYKLGIQDPTSIIPVQVGAPDVSLFQVVNDKLEDEATGFALQMNTSTGNVEKSATEIVQNVITDSIIINRMIDEFVMFICMRFVESVFRIMDIDIKQIKLKTSAEISTEEAKAASLTAILSAAANADPAMIKLRESANYVLQANGFNPDEFLNNDKATNIVNSTNGIDDDVLQKALQIAQKMQVEKNNVIKAQKMMGQFQDSNYKSQLKQYLDELGVLPKSITVPNGQGSMEVPVEAVTPESQVNNKPGVSA